MVRRTSETQSHGYAVHRHIEHAYEHAGQTYEKKTIKHHHHDYDEELI